MQSISEIRRQNLRHMIDTRGGPTEFSKLTGINLSYLVQQGNTEGVTLSLEKGADVIALALAESASHNNTPRPDYIKTLVRLAK